MNQVIANVGSAVRIPQSAASSRSLSRPATQQRPARQHQTGLVSAPPALQLGLSGRYRDEPADLFIARAAAGETATTSQSLASIELSPFINTQGLIQPSIPPGSEAAVFAVYNDRKQLQYVGFSKDLYNALRTLMGRRPDKAFFYKATYLETVDQKQMIDIRSAWFEECGGPPPGNKLALERTAWQKPVSAGAISERGKLQISGGMQAAEEQLKVQLEQIRRRGCKEDFQPDAALMKDGQVDFLPAKAMTPEELEEQQKRIAELAKKTKTVNFELDGQQAQFELFFASSIPTNGGIIYDVTVLHEEMETKHRIILGKEYYEQFNMDPQNVVVMAFTFLLQQKVPRHTEGLMLSNQFPVNYFSISQLDQQFPDFQQVYESQGMKLGGDGRFWRFNKLHDYGHRGEDVKALSAMFKLKEEDPEDTTEEEGVEKTREEEATVTADVVGAQAALEQALATTV